MTKNLQYMLEVNVAENTDIDEFEEFLQHVLLDLYEQGGTESITLTKDGYTESPDIEEIEDAMSEVDSEAVRKAIDLVRKLEKSGDE